MLNIVFIDAAAKFNIHEIIKSSEKQHLISVTHGVKFGTR